jgi:hypothetical protein
MSVAGPPARQNAEPKADPSAAQNVTEAYAFACLNCGYGWEQKYEIAHRTDPAGRAVVTYLVDGVKVPSPLTRPTCQNCEGHLLRIMRPGQVADVTSRHPENQPVAAEEPRAPGTAHHRAPHSPRGFPHRKHDTGAEPPR